jgi:hypothetical protein
VTNFYALHNNSSSIEKNKELYLLDELKVMNARLAQAQTSLNLFVPNHLPSSQVKSLDDVLELIPKPVLR